MGLLLATLLREWLIPVQFDRLPESDLIMEAEEAVSAFARAGRPDGILSGVYAFYAEQSCRMIRPGDRVLDIGCGAATLLASIAALNEEASFVGVDLSGTMIEAGKGSLRHLTTPNVELRVDDMTTLSSIETGSVDVLLSSMALHHLPDTEHLRRCFEAIERVMAPGGRVFISDFGRLKSLKSVEYFVRRAIPRDEPRLEEDYRASLRAAFSTMEFSDALSGDLKRRLSIYSTIVSPVMVVLMTPFPDAPRAMNLKIQRVVGSLPRYRRSDYRQLRLFLRLGGMPCN